MIKNKNIISTLFILICLFFSCKSQYLYELDTNKNHPKKIKIYSQQHTFILDKDFPGEVTVSYIKIDFEAKTIVFSNESYLEGDKKEVTSVLELFKNGEKDYFLVTNNNEIEIPKYVSKHKRKWNDFATPGRSVTRAKKFILSEDSIRYKGSKKTDSYVLDHILTEKINTQ